MHHCKASLRPPHFWQFTFSGPSSIESLPVDSVTGAVVGGTNVVACALVVDSNPVAGSNVVGPKVVSVKRNGQYVATHFSIERTNQSY